MYSIINLYDSSTGYIDFTNSAKFTTFMTTYSPLEQFSVIMVTSLFNNATFYITIYFFLSIVFFFRYLNNSKLIILEDVNTFITYISIKMFKDLIRAITPMSDLVIVVYAVIVAFLILSNSLGVLPLGFTLTAHAVVSLTCSFIIFVWINQVFIFRFLLEWGSLFLPSGTPAAILFLIVPIEVLSYISRMMSLSIRLFANMMSGHTLVHILIGFLFSGISANLLFFIPIIIINLIVYMEIGVAFLQVYVFLILVSLYLQDTRRFDAH